MATIAWTWVTDTKGHTSPLLPPLLFHPFEMAVRCLYRRWCSLSLLIRKTYTGWKPFNHWWLQTRLKHGLSRAWSYCVTGPWFIPLKWLSFQMPYIYLHYLQGILSVLLIISIAELSIAVTITSFRSNCWANSNKVCSMMFVSMYSYWDTSRWPPAC